MCGRKWSRGRDKYKEDSTGCFELLGTLTRDRGSTVFKVLCYKSEGSWFDSRWCPWNFSLT